MPRRKLVSRVEFARRAGVSPAAITKACRAALAPACVDDRIDSAHDAALEYLAKHGRAPDGGRSTVARPHAIGASDPTAPGPETDDPEEPLELDKYGDLTLRELVERFGTERRFRDWVESLGAITRIRREQMSFQASRGELINREMVRTGVFALLDATNRRLLRDAPKTVARRVSAAAKAGQSMEQREKLVRDVISSQLSLAIKTARELLDVSPNAAATRARTREGS